jgi:hypothetical protein
VRGRGIDFEHRFNTSRWAEDLLITTLNEKQGFLVVRFGMSSVVPAGGQLIYGQSDYKEPDLLVFSVKHLNATEMAFLEDRTLTWDERLKLHPKEHLDKLLKKALVALEVEFSPYKAKEMKQRTWAPRSGSDWERRPLKHANPPVAPNIWVKLEDLSKLLAWQADFGIPIVISHLFDQEGFAVALSRIQEFCRQYDRLDQGDQIRLQVTQGIFRKEQRYDRADAQGAVETKTVFVVTPAVAEKIGDIENVEVSTQLGVSSSKKYVSHVIFSGGRISPCSSFVAFLNAGGKLPDVAER